MAAAAQDELRAKHPVTILNFMDIEMCCSGQIIHATEESCKQNPERIRPDWSEAGDGMLHKPWSCQLINSSTVHLTLSALH